MNIVAQETNAAEKDGKAEKVAAAQAREETVITRVYQGMLNQHLIRRSLNYGVPLTILL